MEQGGGGRRDLTGSPKPLDGKRLANKQIQVINMGHEVFVSGLVSIFYKYLKHCQRYFRCVLDHGYCSACQFLIQWYLQVLAALLRRYTGYYIYGIDSKINGKKNEL